jgi:predicted dithiol-disulfide oxidoreductase (DUF899 family)
MTAQTQHTVVARDEWRKMRLAHLVDEEELSRKRDELSRQRRELPWVRIEKSNDFNYDFGVSFTPEGKRKAEVNYNYGMRPFEEELPGISVFYQDDAGDVFHIYSTYGRGVEVMMGAYSYLDLTPKGRDEDGLANPMAWVRHHDKYEEPRQPAECCQHMGGAS